MRRTKGSALAVLSLLLLSCESPPEEPAPEASPPAGEAASGLPAEAGPVVRAEPDAAVEPVVRAMAEALRAAKSLSFRVEAWTDEEVEDGVFASVGASSRVLLRQPDRLFVDRVGEKGHRVFRYDGTAFSVCDPERNVWARIPAPATVEATLDLLHDRYGIVVPLADLLVGDPYEAYTARADRILHLGVRTVAGVPCHHLAFSTDWLAWQLWIPAEGPPLPRRVEIRYLDEPGAPRYVAMLDDWQVDAPATEEDFRFVPPEGSAEIEIREQPVGAGDGDEGR